MMQNQMMQNQSCGNQNYGKQGCGNQNCGSPNYGRAGMSCQQPQPRANTGAACQQPQPRANAGVPCTQPQPRTNAGAPCTQPQPRANAGAPFTQPQPRASAGASRQQLMKQVMLYGFACVDASLYLDTHPDDAEALAYFKEHDRIYREAVEEYSRNYGPLTLSHAHHCGSYWNWVNQPWPWQ